MANHKTVAEKVKLSMSQNIHIHFSSRIDWLDLDVSWSVKTELYLVQITGDTITQSLSDTITPSLKAYSFRLRSTMCPPVILIQ